MMNRKTSRRGQSFIEFAFITLFLIPLFLGTTGVGVNMIKALQLTQLARDAGHMYARGVHFEQAGNRTFLTTIGANVGLSTTPANSKAVVILSRLTYVDNATCIAGGCTTDSSGNAIGCTNKSLWVFTQRLVIGQPSVRTSNFGSPIVCPPSGQCTTGVTPAADGTISTSDYVTKSGAVATFSSINPYAKATDGSVSGLPSGNYVYVSEAAALGFSLPPFMPNARLYSFGMF